MGVAALPLTSAASLGFTGLLKEIVGEVGDLLEQVLIQMGQCVLWEETVIIKEHPRAHPRQKVTTETRVRHYKLTLMHVAFMYCALRLAGILPPLAEWGTKKPWWEVTIAAAAPTLAMFNDWVVPEGVPPIPSDATYDAWWGTHTREVQPPPAAAPSPEHRWVESMKQWYAVGDKYFDPFTHSWVEVV